MKCRQIRMHVEAAFKISDLSKTRIRRIADARFVYYALCYKHANDYTTITSAKAVNKTHASAIYGLKQFKSLWGSWGWEEHQRIYEELDKQFMINRHRKITRRAPDYSRKLSNMVA